jgi:hypothetical protein
LLQEDTDHGRIKTAPLHGITLLQEDTDHGRIKTAPGENDKKSCAITHKMPKTADGCLIPKRTSLVKTVINDTHT